MTTSYASLEVPPKGGETITTIGYGTPDAKTPLRRMEFERATPAANDLVLDVMFCGVCHSDVHQARDEWHNTVWPCVPGHEIVGRVSQIGSNVTRFKVGDLAGIGCMVNSCGKCDACRAGDQQYCENGYLSTYNGPFTPDGTNTFGGYSNKIAVTESFALRIPEKLDPSHAAPLLCAGVTTYSPLKHWKVGKGDKVAIVGLGGLGHIAVQIAAAMECDVTVVTRMGEKESDAKRFGAKAVLVSSDEKAMKNAAGQFDYVLSTIPTKHDVNPFLQLLKTNGVMTICGALEPLEPGPQGNLLAFKRRSLTGSLIGSISETQEVLDFCAAHGVKPQIEMIEMSQINETFDRMVRDEVRYRAVIDMKSLS